MKKKPNLAVVGVTGVVGETFLKVLEERDFQFENFYPMASKDLQVRPFLLKVRTIL